MDLNLISVAKIIWLNTVFVEDAETFGFWTLKPFSKSRKKLWSRYTSNYLAHNIR